MKILPKWYTFQVETGPFFNYYIHTISIRTNRVVFFRMWIHGTKPPCSRLIKPCTVIIQIQSMLLIQLFTIILKRLDILSCTFSKGHSKRIVMGILEYFPILVSYYAVVAQMVRQLEDIHLLCYIVITSIY